MSCLQARISLGMSKTLIWLLVGSCYEAQKHPGLLTEEMVRAMHPGSVIVDVSIEPGRLHRDVQANFAFQPGF